jgi:hypothetical protein
MILRYTPPPAAQPAIDFAFGARAVHLDKDAEVKVAADPEKLPPLPPGVTAEPADAKPARPSRVLAAKRGERFVPLPRQARAAVEIDPKPGKAKGKTEEKD